MPSAARPVQHEMPKTMDEPTAPRLHGRSLDEFVAGLEAGRRAVLSRAITLLESRRADHRRFADALLARVLPRTGGAHRIGVTGVPGVGKSTLLDALGMRLVERGHRLAVLTIDPSSVRTGGSILGDKTRMPNLAAHPAAFIRPSPSGGTLGGVAARTRETILLCEAAGYDLVFVETVGVGQSEVVVAGMVDFFLVLALPGAGDELQGLKKGVLELADAIAVNKAEGENRLRAEQAARHYRDALAILEPEHPEWRPPVLCISARSGEGLDELWQVIERHRTLFQRTSAFEQRRRQQRVAWFRSALADQLERLWSEDPVIAACLRKMERAVAAGQFAPEAAAARVVEELQARLATKRSSAHAHGG